MTSLNNNLNTNRQTQKEENSLEHYPPEEVGLRLHSMKAKTKSEYHQIAPPCIDLISYNIRVLVEQSVAIGLIFPTFDLVKIWSELLTRSQPIS